MSGFWEGWILISAILSEYFASSLTFDFLSESLALNSFRYFIFSLLFRGISAIGVSLIVLNVSLLEVCIFRTFVPGIAKHFSSFKSACPTMATSAISETAYFAEQIKFMCASVEPLSIERCE